MILDLNEMVTCFFVASVLELIVARFTRTFPEDGGKVTEISSLR